MTVLSRSTFTSAVSSIPLENREYLENLEYLGNLEYLENQNEDQELRIMDQQSGKDYLLIQISRY